MSNGFQPIEIDWKGTTYRVAPDQCMELLAMIESILAPPGSGQGILQVLGSPQTAHLTRLARAYAAALRFAGAEVSDQDVYLSLQRDVSKGGMEGYQAILALSGGLMAMFFPDWAEEEPLAGDDEKKGPAAA